MSRPAGRLRTRRLSALLAAATLCLLTVLTLIGTPPAGAVGTTAPAGRAVSIVLNAMTPRSPDPNRPGQAVRFDVTVTNNTDNTYSDVKLGMQRGLPIGRQQLLDQAIRQPPDTDYQVKDTVPLTAPLLPRQTVTLSYRTTSENLCLCFDG
ncbi:MAG: hypothetical protein JO144_17035, partial [Actinobacteria bacterium]|nr:hypothetical protein [Actinomycetota bacterium]